MALDPTLERLMTKMASSKEAPYNRAICASIIQAMFEQYDYALRHIAKEEAHANALLMSAKTVAENNNV